MIKALTATEIYELEELKAELPEAIKAAAPPLTDPPGQLMEGKPLEDWLAAGARVAHIRRRIAELEGRK